jgi:hypothetical protein
MACIEKTSLFRATTTPIILFLLTGLLPSLHAQLHLFNTAEAGEVACIDYHEAENTVSVN